MGEEPLIFRLPPEILDMFFQDLDGNTLVSAILTCSYLHETIIPTIWRKKTVPLSCLMRLLQNSESVRSGSQGSRSDELGENALTPRLRRFLERSESITRLSIREGEILTPDSVDRFRTLMGQAGIDILCPGLLHVEITSMTDFRVAETCALLIGNSVRSMTATGSGKPGILMTSLRSISRLCANITSLTTNVIPGTESTSYVGFHALQFLGHTGLFSMRLWTALSRECPMLKDVSVQGLGYPLDNEAVASGDLLEFPELQSFEMPFNTRPSAIPHILLSSKLPSLKRLHIPVSDENFETQDIPAIAEHVPNIEELSLRMARTINLSLNFESLSALPGLRSLTIDCHLHHQIRDDDVLAFAANLPLLETLILKVDVLLPLRNNFMSHSNPVGLSFTVLEYLATYCEMLQRLEIALDACAFQPSAAQVHFQQLKSLTFSSILLLEDSMEDIAEAIQALAPDAEVKLEPLHVEICPFDYTLGRVVRARFSNRIEKLQYQNNQHSVVWEKNARDFLERLRHLRSSDMTADDEGE